MLSSEIKEIAFKLPKHDLVLQEKLFALYQPLMKCIDAWSSKHSKIQTGHEFTGKLVSPDLTRFLWRSIVVGEYISKETDYRFKPTNYCWGRKSSFLIESIYSDSEEEPKTLSVQQSFL